MVIFGAMDAQECPSKNEIRSQPLLSGISFWLSSFVFCLYTMHLFVVPLFPAYVRLVQRLIINNNIFAVKFFLTHIIFI
jgi:hypothetical protein